ncbi:MAG: cytochrome c [Erythrobacter sp.]|uniref:cytochrome c n=1 Tax=Erythrobacter sp. TaxID=1042 RepID=UPI0025EDCEB0|nr:cytochrome c [Erythrobacter sp.]MCL9999421.1 cytochrome c [Erythrobacter sp.]
MRAAAALILALALAGCDSAPKVVFADASITLPDDPIDLPEGPGRDAVIENCTACHSPSTMLQQPKVSAEKWESIVGKMRKLYKAPVDEAAVPAIVAYMMHVQSLPEASR